MDDVGRLIQQAGAREPVQSLRMERARARVAEHWESVVAARREDTQRRRKLPLAFAASLVLAVAAYYVFLQGPTTEINTMARVERFVGDVTVAGGVAVGGGSIAAQSRIETGIDGRIALRMAGGQSLRVDHASSLVVHSPNHVELLSGGIYIDTEPASNPLPLLVATPLGSARDIGTQFQVRLAESLLIVGVRTGLVEIEGAGQQLVSVNAGRYISLGADGDQSEGELQVDEPGWTWIDSIVPEFDIDGATLKQYLRWYANERGLELRWSDSDSERRAETILLSGSIAGTSLSEGLLIVQRVADFDYRVDHNLFWVNVEQARQ